MSLNWSGTGNVFHNDSGHPPNRSSPARLQRRDTRPVRLKTKIWPSQPSSAETGSFLRARASQTESLEDTLAKGIDRPLAS